MQETMIFTFLLVKQSLTFSNADKNKNGTQITIKYNE